MKDILFVSAFKNIHRENWHVIPRSLTEYLDYFKNMINCIDYRLIVFLEKDMKELVNNLHLYSNIEIRDYSEVNTFYDKYIENERIMINSEEYKKKIPADRKDCPEHWCAEYNMVNHSKINFVAHAKKLYPDYMFYSWIDFGCIRKTIDDVPKLMNLNALQEKIIYMTLSRPYDKIDAEEMLSHHEIYLAGSQFIVHTKLVEKFEDLYEKKLEEWKQRVICDEDQGLVLQLYFDNRHLFQLLPSNEWFALFRLHLNTKIKMESKKSFPGIINSLGLTSKCIEIGVARGAFSSLLLENTNIEKLYLIDPYMNFSLEDYTDGMNKYDMEEEMIKCKQNLEKYSSRIEFFRKLSVGAASKFEDNSIDFCYIDGNHAYKNVLEDLENYWPKVKRGGILAGDDVYEYSESKEVYHFWDGIQNINSSSSFGKYGVHNAVVDFCKKYNLKYYIFDTQFIIFKY